MMNKRVLSFVLCVIMVASLFTGMVSTASADYDTLTHSVKNGDYLFKICKGYGLDYYACKNAIMILNGFVSEAQLNRLTVGQTITLPASNAIAATVKGSTSTTTTTTQTVTINGVTTTTSSTSTLSGVSANYAVAYYLIPHVMQYGETLASVCNDLGTSYGAYSSVILAANGITNANKIWAGKTVYIPSTKAPSAGACYAVIAHTVSSGETMTSICSQYGQSYNANATLINGLNKSTNLNKIYVGQTIYIPVVASASNSSGTPGSSGTQTQSGYNINLKYSSTEGLPYAKIGDTTVTKADEGKTITVVAGAKGGYALKSITATRADNNANIVVKNNSFTMPPCDVNVTFVYSKGFKITRNVVNLNSGTFETLVNDEPVEYACYGDLVTLAFSPKTGYSAQLVKLTPAGGSASTLKQNADGTYSFKMPNSAVAVDVTFEKTTLNPINSKFIDYYEFNNGTIKKLEDVGTITYSVDGVQNTKAAKNTQVVATVTASGNYVLSKVVVVKTGSDPKVVANQLPVTVSDNTYSFKMPDYANGVDVYAMYSKTYAINWNRPKTNGDGGSIKFSSEDADFKQISRATAGQIVYIVATPSSGYTFTTTPSDVTVTYANGASSTPVSKIGTHLQFTMPSNDVVVTPAWIYDSGKLQHAVKLTLEHLSATVKVKDSFGAFNVNDRAVNGDTVRVYVYPNAGWIKDYVNASASIVWPPNPSSDKDGDFYEFTMPNEDVTIKIVYKSNGEVVDITGSKVIMTDGAKAPNVRVLVQGTETDNAKAGYILYAVFDIPDGYKVKVDSNNVPEAYIERYKSGSPINNDKVSADVNGVFYYTIRETDLDKTKYDNVRFTIYLEPSKTDTTYELLRNNNDYRILVDGTEKYEAYKEHEITIENTAVGKKIKTAKAFTGNPGSPNYLELKTMTEGEKYSFIMPGEAVTTEVELADLKTISFYGDGNAYAPTPMSEIAGEIITAEYTFNTGYMPDEIKANGAEMPAGSYTWDAGSSKLTIVYTVEDAGNTIEVTSKSI